jgi:hypothetical protein
MLGGFCSRIRTTHSDQVVLTCRTPVFLIPFMKKESHSLVLQMSSIDIIKMLHLTGIKTIQSQGALRDFEMTQAIQKRCESAK